MHAQSSWRYALALLAALAVWTAPASAATITVDSLDDYDFPTSPQSNDGTGCTLRKAIANANNNAQAFTDCAAGESGLDTIVFSVSGTIELGTLGGPLFVNDDLRIQGPIVIDANGEDGIFRINLGGRALELDGITLRGSANGAVTIASATSSLQVSGSLFEGNSVGGSGGAAIRSSGPIAIQGTTFLANSHEGSSSGGGAIHLTSGDPSSITNSFFTGNSSKRSGGAIWYHSSGSQSSLTITNTVFLTNLAQASGGSGEGGGAIWHQGGLLALLNSTFTSNLVTGSEGRGGALYRAAANTPTLIDHNLFTQNMVQGGDDGMGGALYAGGRAVVRASAFVGNSAGTGLGGGIATDALIKSSDFSNPGFTIANSTVAANTARMGGGFYLFAASGTRGMTLLNVTVAENSADEEGGGIQVAGVGPPEADLRNVILADNSAPAGANCGGSPVHSQAGNLLWPGGTCSANGPGGFVVGDPMLGPAQPNAPDVLTLSMALQEGSAALEIGDPATCAGFAVLNLDQRSLVAPIRPDPAGTDCDAGAFESSKRPPAPAIEIAPSTGLAFGAVAVGAIAELTATVSNPGLEGATGLAIGVSGAGFAVADTDCGTDLGPLASCTVDVAFTPTAEQAFSGTLSATADGGLADSVPLSGSGFLPNPAFDLSPDAGLDFAGQAVGTTSTTLPATLTNSGTEAITDIAFGASGDFSVASDDCPSSLDPTESCTADIDFTPTATGLRTGTLTATGNANGTPLADSIPLRGTGTAPAALDLQPAAGLDFGPVEVGTTSEILVATLTNTGTEPATSLSIGVVGGTVFSLVGGNCVGLGTLPGGASCTAQIRFTPSSVGGHNDNLDAFADGPLIIGITLLGEGFRPGVIALAPPSGLDFDEVETGTVSPPGFVTVTNTGGSGALDLENLTVTTGGEFPHTHNCPPTLVPSASCTVTVEFAPVTDGVKLSAVSVTAVTGGAAVAAQAPLSGIAFTPSQLALSPAAGIAFGSVAVGESAAAITVLTNTGSQLVSLNPPTVAPGPPFDLVGGTTCGSALEGGASCQFGVGFAPTGDGAASGDLSATGAIGLEGVGDSIPLSGTGFSPTGSLSLAPAAGLGFGNVALGATSGVLVATLENVGGASITGINIVATAPFALVGGGSCGSTLAAGATCTAHLTFAPTVEGEEVGSLSASGDGGHFDQITLRGTGFDATQPTFGSDPAAPGPIDFGAEAVGSTAVRPFTVRNLGGDSLVVGSPTITGAQADEFQVASELPVVLGSGAEAAISLACTPGGLGTRSALLTLLTTDPDLPQVSFSLVCEGSDVLGLKVFSGPTATGSGTFTATLSGGGAPCGFTAATLLPPPPGAPPVPPTAPGGFAFPHGLFDFTLEDCTPGGTVTLTLEYPASLPAGTVYWKYGPTIDDPAPHWYELPASIAGATVVIEITDGGLGDDDLLPNGTIVDQGGPGVHQSILEIPFASPLGLLLLALMVAAAGAWALRRVVAG